MSKEKVMKLEKEVINHFLSKNNFLSKEENKQIKESNHFELGKLADEVCTKLWYEQNNEVDQQTKFYNSIPKLSEESGRNPLHLCEIERILEKFIMFWKFKVHKNLIDMCKTNMVEHLEAILIEVKKRNEEEGERLEALNAELEAEGIEREERKVRKLCTTK